MRGPPTKEEQQNPSSEEGVDENAEDEKTEQAEKEDSGSTKNEAEENGNEEVDTMNAGAEVDQNGKDVEGEKVAKNDENAEEKEEETVDGKKVDLDTKGHELDWGAAVPPAKSNYDDVDQTSNFHKSESYSSTQTKTSEEPKYPFANLDFFGPGSGAVLVYGFFVIMCLGLCVVGYHSMSDKGGHKSGGKHTKIGSSGHSGSSVIGKRTNAAIE